MATLSVDGYEEIGDDETAHKTIPTMSELWRQR
jgi:hypothetical protein